jgi:hypothetical protein
VASCSRAVTTYELKAAGGRHAVRLLGCSCPAHPVPPQPAAGPPCAARAPPPARAQLLPAGQGRSTGEPWFWVRITATTSLRAAFRSAPCRQHGVAAHWCAAACTRLLGSRQRRALPGLDIAASRLPLLLLLLLALVIRTVCQVYHLEGPRGLVLGLIPTLDLLLLLSWHELLLSVRVGRCVLQRQLPGSCSLPLHLLEHLQTQRRDWRGRRSCRASRSGSSGGPDTRGRQPSSRPSDPP